MGGDLVEFAAFLVEAEPPAFAVGVVVIDLHAEHGGDPGEAEDHDGDQSAVAETDQAGRAVVGLAQFRGRADLERDAIQEGPGVVGIEDVGFAFADDVLGTADTGGGVGVDDMSGDEPVEEHSEGGQVLLDGGLGLGLLEFST